MLKENFAANASKKTCLEASLEWKCPIPKPRCVVSQCFEPPLYCLNLSATLSKLSFSLSAALLLYLNLF